MAKVSKTGTTRRDPSKRVKKRNRGKKGWAKGKQKA